jgi:general secretion pathway protein D
MIAAVTLKDNLSLGVAAMFKGTVGGLDVKFGVNPGALSATDPAKLSQTGFTFLGTDSSGEVRALITALATDSKAKLLATPHILVSDNREAKIQVGQAVPLVTSQTYGTPGVSPVQTIQYRDIGIILKVKPRVNEGGLVSLEIYQEVSTFETITLGIADKQIIINKTDATTNVVVQNNQTIVIGGLIREDKTKSASGIPFLSRIPLIGWAFGSWDDSDSRQELIILLTPRVIRSAEEAASVTSGFVDNMSETSKGGIRKEELMREKTPK